MKKLNMYVTEAWSGVKKQTIHQHIIDWCEEMGIEKYTINSKGEIDVNGDVDLNKKDFKELPYKFGKVDDWFDIGYNKNLISLKNCPDFVGGIFSCGFCRNLKSLEGCPKEVGKGFYCYDCKKKFTEEEVLSLCKVDQHRISI